MELTIFTDGGARGNPGPAGLGVYAVNDDDQVVAEFSEYLGVATNNEAEYEGFLRSLTWLIGFMDGKDITAVTWKLDSKLVVEQLNKNWKIKEQRLEKLALRAWQHLQNLPFDYQITYVPRSENVQADRLVNEALDNQT